MKYLILIAIVALTGCASVEREVKSVTDRICALSEIDKQALAEKFDKITAPNKIRVECGE